MLLLIMRRCRACVPLWPVFRNILQVLVVVVLFLRGPLYWGRLFGCLVYVAGCRPAK